MRHLLSSLLVATSSILVTQAAIATTNYPTQAINLVVPYSAGGFTDILARLLSKKLSSTLDTNIIVENRPGAGTNIAAHYVTRAKADGYTLLAGTSSLAINPTLYKNLNYDPANDLQAVGVFATTPYVLLSNSNTTFTDIPGLIEYAKANPNSLSYGSSGNGSVNHLAGALFSGLTSTDLLHVPYKGSQAALIDLLGDRIDLYWSSVMEAVPLIKEGKVRALGVTSPEALAMLPELAPIGEVVPNYEVGFWMGIFSPKGTAPEDIQVIAKALQDLANDPEVQDSFAAQGVQSIFLNPEQTRSLLEADTAKWAEVIKSANASVD